MIKKVLVAKQNILLYHERITRKEVIGITYRDKKTPVLSRHFVNLNADKKKAIFEAACREFSQYSYSNMRISRFIKEAKISRASFYLYFKDKSELFCYMLDELTHEAKMDFLEYLGLQNGNFYQAAIHTIQQFPDKGRERICMVLCQQIMFEKECQDMALLVIKQGLETGAWTQFVSRCYERRNPQLYPELTEKQLEYALEMMASIVIKFFIIYALGNHNKNELLQNIDMELQIVERALERTSISYI